METLKTGADEAKLFVGIMGGLLEQNVIDTLLDTEKKAHQKARQRRFS